MEKRLIELCVKKNRHNGVISFIIHLLGLADTHIDTHTPACTASYFTLGSEEWEGGSHDSSQGLTHGRKIDVGR